MFKKPDYISSAERKGSFQPFTSRDLMLVLLVQVLALNETRMIFFPPGFGSEIRKNEFSEKFIQSKIQLYVTKVSKFIKNCR